MKCKKFIVIISIVCILAVMLCIPAFATVTESVGDGFSLFGGVKLPNLDGLDISLDDYPARIIIPSDDGYILFLSTRSFDVPSVKPFVQSSGSYTFANGPATVRYYMYNDVDSSWDFESTFSLPEMTSRSLGDTAPIWSNGDFINDLTASVIVPASNPISLDNYNLIKWDGDTTGLDFFTDDWYNLSSFVDPIDALAVYNGLVSNDFRHFNLDAGTAWYLPPIGSGAYYVIAGDSAAAASVGLPSSGIYAFNDGNSYVSLIAYRTVEEPPGEGGDEPDEPQPPFGAAEVYIKLHLLALTPQLK